MAENKKSFVLYTEFIETFEALSDEEAGKLVKHLFRYVNDLNPETDNPMVKLAFIPIKQALKRDLKKYEDYVKKQSLNGAKGGRPKKPKETQKTQPFLEKPKKADNVIVNDNVNDNKQQKEKIVDADLFKNEIPKNEHRTWRESWYMKFRTKPGSLSDLLDSFNIHLGLKEENEKPKNLKDYKQHFYNWCNVQDRIQNLDAYKKGKKEGAL